METGKIRVSDYILEQYAMGELPQPRMADLNQRIASDPDLAARLEALRSSNQQILRRYPPGWFAGEVAKRAGVSRAKASPSRSWHRASLLALVPVVSAAVLALFVLRAPDDVSSPIPGLGELEGTRIKGMSPRLTVYRKAGKQVIRIDSTLAVQSGDILQLSYVAAGRAFGVIVSVDGRGATTLHFPETPGASTELAQEGETPIRHAYEIDDAPEFERFFFVSDSLPVSVTEVLRAAEELARTPGEAAHRMLSLPTIQQHAVLVYKKEVRR
ncbi:ActD protein [Candidatus Fermentibacteria bacterium]|nr:ActD protein [Candidatus Fermentibacteria bacterium]